MKLYFNTFIAVLLLGLTLVSCNNDFDEDVHYSYPEGFELGMWTSEAGTGNAYTVNITLNEAGDTIGDVTIYNAETGDANVLSAGKVKYVPEVGSIEISYEESQWELPAFVSLSFRAGDQSINANIYTVRKGKDLLPKASFRAVKSNTISVYGDWQLADGTIVSLAADGTATVIVGEGSAVKATYTNEDGKVVVKAADGMVIEMALNNLGQMFATVGGKQVYAQHIMTQPKNDWYDYAYGVYQNWVFGTSKERTLEYSPSRRMARIEGFSPVPGSAALTFYWNIGEETVTHAEQMYDTGFDFVDNGTEYGRVFAMPVAITEDGQTALFDAKQQAFIFGHGYVIPGVLQFTNPQPIDAFVITEVVGE